MPCPPPGRIGLNRRHADLSINLRIIQKGNFRKVGNFRRRGNINRINAANGPTNIMYLKLPYLNNEVDHQLKRIFKREGINIRISHKAKTLRSQLQRTRPKQCTLSECPIGEDHICNRQKVVYTVDLHAKSVDLHI